MIYNATFTLSFPYMHVLFLSSLFYTTVLFAYFCTHSILHLLLKKKKKKLSCHLAEQAPISPFLFRSIMPGLRLLLKNTSLLSVHPVAPRTLLGIFWSIKHQLGEDRHLYILMLPINMAYQFVFSCISKVL